MARNNQQFTTIRTEGALLPPDILQRIVSQKVDGMRPADYHLPEGFKTTEAITQSWDMLKKHWKSFQDAKEQLADTDTGTSMTNERWLLPLFRELDYGRLTTETAPVIEERTYPIERFYNNTPIHLIGWNLTLDRRTKGARGAATSSPHSMVQEYLNRSEAHLWAFVSNGRQLRLLRDNVALSRQAYVEFDLEAMMEGEVYSDFALLWMLCHQSRVEAEKTEDCWLEKWSKLAREDGTRVLNNLRTGVADAIEALGRGFLAHPRNDELRRKLQESGSLSKDDFYRQLLRIVYRLLFLFVAEDRELLHPLDAEENAKELYRKYYSTIRLRDMSLKLRGSKHGDLWHSLSLVFAALGKNEGCPQLGLVGLGSFLWNSKSVADLAGPHEVIGDTIPVQIANDDLLTAIRALAYVEQDRVLRSVDYRNLGSEELGSVYESLLELHPDIHVEARHFELRTAAGNERKTTGSYYTPDSLVQCLLDSALDPVVADRRKGKKGEEAESAILDIKVCDPACGSGHFLIAAAHRLARHLARIRTGETEPSPEDHQHALRDVIGRCIYGVDINPMAVELCKVSLWIEAIEPGKPLSFLDSHIQCGNSLLGTTPKLLADGIPDDAFKTIEGDDNKVVAELKRRNKAERKDRTHGQKLLFGLQEGADALANQFNELSELDDSTIAAVSAKEERYGTLLDSDSYQISQLIADAWCSAFLWTKNDSQKGKLCPTDRDLADLKENPMEAANGLKAGVLQLKRQHMFFHWHLAFPDVFVLPEGKSEAENNETGCDRGFDVVLGNPPWDHVELKEKEWFATRQPEIANASTGAKRKRLIAELEHADPLLFKEYSVAKREHIGFAKYLGSSGRFPLCGRGRINLYTVFSELAKTVVNASGRVGILVPSGIATDDTTKFFFAELTESKRLISLFDFENGNIFPNVHSSYKFCLLTMGGASTAKFAFFCRDTSEAVSSTKQFSLSAEEIRLLNPNTGNCPIFRSQKDASLTIHIYSRVPVLILEGDEPKNPWRIQFRQGLFNMTTDSDKFHEVANLSESGYERRQNKFARNGVLEMLPVVEAKMLHQYDHRWASHDEVGFTELTLKEKENPETTVNGRYWVSASHIRESANSMLPYFVMIRRFGRNTDVRTLISSLFPPYGSSDSSTLLLSDVKLPCLTACFNSFAADYAARQKIGGTMVNQFILNQLPIFGPEFYDQNCDWNTSEVLRKFIEQHVLELTYTAWDLQPFALDCGYDGPPFRWDEERRFLLRCELDAAYFHLYLGSLSEWGTDSLQLREMSATPRDAVDYIMETFPIVKRKDIKRTEVLNDAGEVIQEGTYFTKDTILSIYDEMQRAIESGQPYQSRLDPPPGPPTDADGNFIPMAQWDPNNWPSHIHPPRKTDASQSEAQS